MNPYRIAVIVLTWNSARKAPATLDALLASDYPALQIIVVDNGSQDDTLGRLRAYIPILTLVAHGRNAGFCGGNNIGLRLALAQSGARRVDAALLLNDDAIVAPDTLSRLADASRRSARGGLFGPKVLIANPPVPTTAPTLLSAGGDLRHGWQAWQRGLGETDQGQYDSQTQVDFLSGCALLATRNFLETVGLLDERYFMYYEDVDWSWRARQAGFAVDWLAQAHVWHPDTRARADSPALDYYLTRNSLLFAKKRGLGYPIQAAMTLGYLRTILSWTLRPRWRHLQAHRHAKAAALRDFWRGRSGPWLQA